MASTHPAHAAPMPGERFAPDERFAATSEGAPRTPRTPLDGARAPLGAAALCLLAMACTWLLVTFVPAVRWHDADALRALAHPGDARLEGLARDLLNLIEPGPFTALALALIALALLRRRVAVALAIALVMGLAPLSADLLKPLLAHPHYYVPYASVASASWPSGHSCAAASLALCALLVAPPRLRAAVGAIGAMFVALVGLALLVLAWHMPSDVLGGCLLAMLWFACALAGLRAADARSRSRRLRRVLAAPGSVGARVP